jgi:aspartyl-tRNA(Asn)/glutamyl-tRNA(Gln) amidotransferase subunit B
VEAFRGGKTKLQGFFVGQLMKQTGGKADPKLVNQILIQQLKG